MIGPGQPPATLASGQSLSGDQSATSVNGAYRLIYQLDGNLVIDRTSDGVPMWSSGTAGTSVGETVMQSDGNLVIYDGSGTPVRSTGTAGQFGAYLVLDNDSQLIVYASDGATILWTNW